MDDQNNLAPVTPVVLPLTPPMPEGLNPVVPPIAPIQPLPVTAPPAPSAPPEPEWPGSKPKSKMPQILGGIAAIILVVGVATAAYFVSNKISGRQAVAPTAPESEPLAWKCFDGATRCSNNRRQTCENGSWVDEGDACVSPTIPTKPPITPTKTPTEGGKCEYCSSNKCVRCTGDRLSVGECSSDSECGTTPTTAACEKTKVCADGTMICPKQSCPTVVPTTKPTKKPGGGSCKEQCPGSDGVLRSCTPPEDDGSSRDSNCDTAGRVESCGNKPYCCPSAGGAWTTDMKKCGGGACKITPPKGLKITNITGTSATLSWTPGTGGNYIKLWVSSNPKGNPTDDCGRLPSRKTDAVCVANENTDYYLKAVPSTYKVTGMKPNTKYYWRLIMWKQSGCDQEAPTVSFTTTAITPTLTPTPGVGACMEVALYAKICQPGTPGGVTCLAEGYQTTPMTAAQRAKLHVGDKIRIAITGNKANLKARFRVFIDGVVETPVWKLGQGYSGADKKTMWYSDYEIKKSGSYKFEGQVTTEP